MYNKAVSYVENIPKWILCCIHFVVVASGSSVFDDKTKFNYGHRKERNMANSTTFNGKWKSKQ